MNTHLQNTVIKAIRTLTNVASNNLARTIRDELEKLDAHVKDLKECQREMSAVEYAISRTFHRLNLSERDILSMAEQYWRGELKFSGEERHREFLGFKQEFINLSMRR